MPWMNLGTETNGRCKICCAVMVDRYITKPDGTPYLLQKDHVDDIFNSRYVQDVRQKMLRGEWPEDCGYCQKQEAAGEFSPRAEFNERWLNPEIQARIEATARGEEDIGRPMSLEPRHGTTCNLRCTTCWSLSSSSILTERKAALAGKFGEVPEFLRLDWESEIARSADSDFDWSEEPAYLENFRACLPTLRRLYFTGGEPMMVRSIKRLLAEALERGRKDLAIQFTTNLTHLDDELIDLALRFERFDLTGSVEGFGAVNEYLRFPSSWERIEANLRKLHRRGVSLALMTVVQIANVGAYADLLRWLARDPELSGMRVLPTMLQNPSYLRAELLPGKLKELELQRVRAALDDERVPDENRSRLKQVYDQMRTVHPEAEFLRERFREATLFFDRARGTNFGDVFPTLRPLLKHRINRRHVEGETFLDFDGTARAPVEDSVDPETFDPFCLAPWVHTYMHTSGERRLCCVSEAASELEESAPLESYWNSEGMKQVRRQMMRGEAPAACKSCMGCPNPYKRHFEPLYGPWKKELALVTRPDGSVENLPSSYDYRLSNLCNFKCQMCGTDYSSSWQREVVQAGLEQTLPEWLREPRYGAIQRRHEEVSEPELMNAIETRALRELYWAGGEPLIMPIHWRAMKRIVEMESASDVYVRYNTNFSSLQYRGQHLFRDILKHFPRFEISASLDATGRIGEYLRTGLKWDTWRKNLDESLPYLDRGQRTLAIEHRITTPGMFDLRNILLLQRETGVFLRTKLVHVDEQSPSLRPLSPLIFPRELLRRWVEETLEEIVDLRTPDHESVFNELEFIANSTPFPELYPDRYEAVLRIGLRDTLALEKRRGYPERGQTFLGCFETKRYLQDWLMRFI